MRLVSVAAAGGLNSVFTGTDEACMRAAEDVHAYLGTIEGRGPVLVRSAV
jgi:hypothetical protein